MKILIVSQYYYPDPFSVALVAEELQKRGHDVTVLTGKPNYGYYRIVPGYENRDFEILNGVKVYRVNVKPRKGKALSIVKNYLSYWHNAKKFVRKLDDDFDIVYSVSLSPVMSIAPAIKYAKKHKIKHILHCLDLWPESVVATGMVKRNGLAHKLLYKWSKDLYRQTDEILISSPSFQNYFSDVLKIDKKCVYLPQATNEYPRIKKQDAYEYDHNYLNLVYCGNIGRVQLIDEIINAIELTKGHLLVRLYVIGLGSLKDYLLKKIKEKNLEDNIIYLGAIASENAINYFPNADAMYLGLNGDNMLGTTIPNKLTFYMSQCKPIIASITGDGKKIILDAKGGIVCDNNKESIKEAILEFAKLSKKEKENMAQNNLKYYKEHFNNQKIVAQIEEEMKKLAN